MLCENKCSCFQYAAGRVFCWSVSQQYAWTSQALRSSKHFERKYFLTLSSLNNKQAHTFLFQIWVRFCLLTSLTPSCFIFFSHLRRSCVFFSSSRWQLPRPHVVPAGEWIICFGLKDRGTIACGLVLLCVTLSLYISSINSAYIFLAYSEPILVSSTRRWMETHHVVHWFLSSSCCSSAWISNTAPPMQ